MLVCATGICGCPSLLYLLCHPPVTRGKRISSKQRTVCAVLHRIEWGHVLEIIAVYWLKSCT